MQKSKKGPNCDAEMRGGNPGQREWKINRKAFFHVPVLLSPLFPQSLELFRFQHLLFTFFAKNEGRTGIKNDNISAEVETR